MQWLKKCYSEPLSRPRTSLICIFIVWKLLLLCVAVATPGDGYDTSTVLHLDRYQAPSSFLGRMALKLTRWDAIYFTTSASRGYLYEQEWAFGWGSITLTSQISKIFNLELSNVYNVALVAIFIAHACHLLSVLCLYQFGRSVFPFKGGRDRLAFIAASLHVIAPAGLFLSAPNSESLYSSLSFAAAAAYASSFRVAPGAPQRSLRDDGFLLLSGLIFGFAATVRGNGLFNGLIFAYDAMTVVINLPRVLKSWPWVRYAVCVGISGLLTGLGFAYPQYLAYREFCIGDGLPAVSKAAWCTALPPSIYAYVQDAYWQNGFLRYWRPANLSLFVLAAPTIAVLQYSGILALTGRLQDANTTSHQVKPAKPAKLKQEKLSAQDSLLRLALPQLFIASLVITNMHVQIITRLASGYPLMYLWLAREISGRGRYAKITVRWMIIYAVVQAGCYASFLPPA